MHAMEDCQSALPARPQSAAAPGDESAWLYDSQRTYADQLRAYKGHGNGTHPEEEAEC